MGGSLLLFFCGFKFYYRQKPTERPLDVIFKVFRAAISKRDLEYPHDSAQFYWKGRPNEKLLKNHSNQILLLPKVLFFRWLDKAAIKPRYLIRFAGRPESWEWLPAILSLLNKVAIWNGPIATVKLGRSEVQRLKKIRRHEIAPGDEIALGDEIISMSTLWLLPQFTLLGLMEGFAHEGLEEFFDNHILSKSMRNYGPLFTECVLGFGNFFSIPCVLLFKSWFKDTVNESHLDRYFLALAILSSVFLGFYVYTSISKYAHEEDLLKEVELANASQEEDGGNDQITIEGHPSPSPSVSNTTQADGSGEDKAESRPNKSQFYNLWRKVFNATASQPLATSTLA
uniref:Uncharacterized protein n=1 Tax=Fagus sylvatica TaxID=28930 RepID=A0A2N9H941_FAGSY